MSLKPQNSYIVPEDTEKVAQAILPDGSVYRQINATFGTLFQDDDFASFFPIDGQPTEAPYRLMLVLILQFLENLTDWQAADAVRTRIDWKYLLCLPLTDPGFHYSVLSEFRKRLIQGRAERAVFEKLLTIFREKDFLRGHHQQRTDSTHILGAIRAINRVELVGETIRRVLDTVAIVAPDWMKKNSQPDWIDRYGNRIEDARLPKSTPERVALVEQIGADGLSCSTPFGNPKLPLGYVSSPRSKCSSGFGSRIIPGKRRDVYAGGMKMKFHPPPS